MKTRISASILDGLDPQLLHVETVNGTWTPVK
jgi:hypothetical protein